MKKWLYALLATGIIFSSCGFVVAEKNPDAVKATYPAKVEITTSGRLTGTVKTGDTVKKATLTKTIDSTTTAQTTKLKPRDAVK